MVLWWDGAAREIILFMKIDRFEDVIAWQKARDLNKELFKYFKMSRDFTFRDQILRASLSITNNIAEGFERGGKKELRQFLVIARGSAAEVRSMLYTAIDNHYLTAERGIQLINQITDVGKLLTGFIKSLASTPKTIPPSHHPTIGPSR